MYEGPPNSELDSQINIENEHGGDFSKTNDCNAVQEQK